MPIVLTYVINHEGYMFYWSHPNSTYVHDIKGSEEIVAHLIQYEALVVDFLNSSW